MSRNKRTKPQWKIMHVVIPGVETYNQFFDAKHSPVLKKLLKTSTRTAVTDDYYGLIYSLFQKHSSQCDSREFSVAALRKNSLPINPDDFYMCADPVYMQADRDQLLMFDSEQLQINRTEAESIIESLNLHFGEDGLEFSVIDCSRWVVRVNKLTEVITTPLYRVVNRPLLDVMPQGKDGGRWKSIINEVQMLLHNHKVNDLRQEKGLNAINGIWFWGESMASVTSGAGEDDLCSNKLAQVYTDDQWLCRMADRHQIPVRSTTALDKGAFKSPLNCISDDSLYLDSQLSNEYGRLSIEQYKAWVSGNEKNLWLAIKVKLLEGVFNQINFYPGDGYCYKIKRRSLLQTLSGLPASITKWITRKLGR